MVCAGFSCAAPACFGLGAGLPRTKWLVLSQRAAVTVTRAMYTWACRDARVVLTRTYFLAPLLTCNVPRLLMPSCFDSTQAPWAMQCFAVIPKKKASK